MTPHTHTPAASAPALTPANNAPTPTGEDGAPIVAMVDALTRSRPRRRRRGRRKHARNTQPAALAASPAGGDAA